MVLLWAFSDNSRSCGVRIDFIQNTPKKRKETSERDIILSRVRVFLLMADTLCQILGEPNYCFSY